MNKTGFVHPEVLILVILVAISVLFGYRYLKQNLPIERPNDVINLKLSTSGNTSDWKTYKNEEYGFEFKYPSNWYFETGPAVSLRDVFGPQISFFVEGTDPDFSKGNDDGNDMLTLYVSTDVDYFDEIPSLYKGSHKIVIDGKEAMKASSELAIIKLSNETLLNIKVEQSSAFPERFDQILSTFEFIDSNETIVNAEISNIPNIPSGFSWSEPTPYEGTGYHDLTILYNDEYFLVPIKGKEWKATMINLTGQKREEIYNDFHSTVKDFEKLGWTWPTVNGYGLLGASADSPAGGTGGLVGYNNGKVRVVSWSTNTKYKTGEMPRSHGRPCDMEFRYFLSDIVPFSDLVSQLDEK